jgi:hypothetical protein
MIRWHRVVEELESDASASDPNSGPFSVVSSIPQTELHGVVAIRINFPFEASTLSAYRSGDTLNEVVLADDDHVGVEAGSNAPGTQLTVNTSQGLYSGPWGLGNMYALGQKVRPFSRFLTAQSLFRREVFK